MKRVRVGISDDDFANLKSAIDESAIVAITDKSGVITYVNEKFCKISQYGADELIGRTHQVINSGYHPKEFFTDMWKTITSGKNWEGEIRNRAKDGTFYWVHTNIVPFMNSDGRPEKYVSVRYEITERKMAEDKLLVYSKKLEVSNRELQDFASVAAHDLQEPLRKIQSFSDRLKTKAANELTSESLDYFDRIQNAAHRMQILINDLLTYSRVTTKAQPFQKIDLNKIVAQVVSDLVVRIETSKGKVEWSHLPTVEGDATQMYQLFQNIIGNALKFHRRDQPPHVKVSASLVETAERNQKSAVYEIRIEDNGIGFDEKYLDRIFTIFQRLHGRQEYEGTGIGLAVCRKIIDRHGGRLTARSAPGEGATFLFTLPSQQKGENL